MNYSLPSIIGAYTPNHMLAHWASILKDSGYDYRIKDFATLDTLINFSTPIEIRKSFIKAYKIFDEHIRKRKSISQTDINNYFSIKNNIKKHLQKKLNILAENVSDYIFNNNFDAVLFDLNREGYKESLEIQKIIKKNHPTIKIISGGRQVIWGRERVLEHSPSDALIYGYGDYSVSETLDALINNKSMESIANVIYKKNNNSRELIISNPSDLNKLPLEEYDMDKYSALLEFGNKLPLFKIQFSRGCPNRCSYCERFVLYGGKVMKKDTSRIIDGMNSILKKYGTKSFKDVGDNTPPVHLLKLSEQILKNNVDVDILGFGEFNLFDKLKKKDYKLLADAGFRSFFLGLESGNKKIQKYLNKEINLENAKAVVDNLRYNNINTSVGYIYKLPFEDEEGKKATINFMSHVHPDSNVIIPLGVLPGTEFYNNRDKYEIELAKDNKGLEHPKKYLDSLLFCNLPYSSHNSEFAKINLDYKINGEDFSKIIMDSMPLHIYSSANGMPTGVLEDQLYFADLLNMSVADFKHYHDDIFLERDPDKMKDFFVKISEQMKSKN